MSSSTRDSSGDSLRESLAALGPTQRGDLIALMLRLSGREPAQGLQIGEYRLRQEIGRGGMGIVFLADQVTVPGRRVAVKLLLAPAGQATARKRFAREVAAAGRLDHPNIVPVLGADIDGPIPWYSMKFVDGNPLSAVLQDARWRSDAMRVARVIRELAAALDHAHRNGVVHRDVKPGNVMIDRAGHARLLDFGLAHLIEVASEVTLSGDAVGTADYMAPEQIDERWGRVGNRTDVYGLGVTLYECLTGRRPFARTRRKATAEAIRDGTATPLRTVDPTLPRDLATICQKAMRRDPRDRYATAREFAADLDRFLENRPVRATPPGWAHHAGHFLARHRSRIGAAAVALVVFVACAWSWGRLRPAWEADARMPAIEAGFAARLELESRIAACASASPTRERKELMARAAAIDADLERSLSLALAICPWHTAARRRTADLLALQLRIALEGAGLKWRSTRIRSLEQRLAESDQEGRHALLLDRRSRVAVRCARGPARVWLCRETLSSGGVEGFADIGSAEALDLGTVPLATEVPEGHYAIRARLPGHEDVVLPWLLRRAAVQAAREAAVDLELLTREEIGRGFRQVHAGFAVESDHDQLREERGDLLRWVDGFCMSEWEVTVGDLRRLGVDVDAVLGPDHPASSDALITELTLERLLAIVTARNDVEAREGARFRASLPTPAEWRRAARGADGRSHAWGARFDGRKLRSWRPASVYRERVRDPERVADRSPFGLFDMTGGLAEVCIDLQPIAEGRVPSLFRCGGDSSIPIPHETALTMVQPFEDASAWGPLTALRLVRRRLPEPRDPTSIGPVTLAPGHSWSALAVHGPFGLELHDRPEFRDGTMIARGFTGHFSPRVLVWHPLHLTRDEWSLEVVLAWNCEGDDRPVELVLGTTPHGIERDGRIGLLLGRRECSLSCGPSGPIRRTVPTTSPREPIEVRLASRSGRIEATIATASGESVDIDGGEVAGSSGSLAYAGFCLPTLVGMELVVSDLRITQR